MWTATGGRTGPRELYVPCVNGPYYHEHIAAILREIAVRYRPEVLPTISGAASSAIASAIATTARESFAPIPAGICLARKIGRIRRTAPGLNGATSAASYLVHRQPVASVGVVWSQRSGDFFGRDDWSAQAALPADGFCGLWSARDSYLPVEIDDIERDDAAQPRLLILPNIGSLSDAQVASLRRFVQRGGGLLATGQTSLCAARGRGPGLIDCHLYRQPGRTILHLVNLTSAGTWRAPVDEVIPVGPLQVRVRMPPDVRGQSARLLVSGRPVPVVTKLAGPASRSPPCSIMT